MRLFDEMECYTEDAQLLAGRFRLALGKVAKTIIKENPHISLRQLEYIAAGEVGTTFNFLLLNQMHLRLKGLPLDHVPVDQQSELEKLDMEELLDIVFSYQTGQRLKRKQGANQELIRRLKEAGLVFESDW